MGGAIVGRVMAAEALLSSFPLLFCLGLSSWDSARQTQGVSYLLVKAV